MGTRIGLIAGSGEFPFMALDEAKRQGYTCLVAGILGEATVNLKLKADEFEWILPEEMSKLFSFFRKHGIHETLVVGKIQPGTIYKKGVTDETTLRFLSRIRDRNPLAVLKALIDFMAEEGIDVKDPAFLVTPYFCQEGVLTEAKPTPEVMEDIDFGWSLAKSLADLDIGQTIIVKARAVVAVESMEGTDEAIKRGGRLAGEGIVVIKVARTKQDMRLDMPAVGLETLRSLIRIRGAALCFEALRMPFFQKEESVSLAKANGISIMAKKP